MHRLQLEKHFGCGSWQIWFEICRYCKTTCLLLHSWCWTGDVEQGLWSCRLWNNLLHSRVVMLCSRCLTSLPEIIALINCLLMNVTTEIWCRYCLYIAVYWPYLILADYGGGFLGWLKWEPDRSQGCGTIDRPEGRSDDSLLPLVFTPCAWGG